MILRKNFTDLKNLLKQTPKTSCGFFSQIPELKTEYYNVT